jgi:ABC-type molybdate transport system substrate-binding protein
MNGKSYITQVNRSTAGIRSRESVSVRDEHASRDGEINPVLLLLTAAAIAAAILIALLPGARKQDDSSARPLTMLVAAGLRTAVEQILPEYEQEYGVRVEVQYGGSNMLLNQLKVNKFDQPDLYLAADAFFTDQAVAEGLATEVIPIAYQEPVIAFRTDRPLSVTKWTDLLEKELRWSIADPDQAAIGKSVRQLLSTIPLNDAESTSDLWQQLESQTTRSGVFKPTVNEVANDIKIGAVDAGFIWNSTVASPEYKSELSFITLSQLEETSSLNELGDLISIAVLNSSPDPTSALRFARYISAQDRGLAVFESFGMKPVEGDVWALKPEVTFFCGAVNRRAIEPVIEAFQKREGVVVNTVFDGCGILTGRMGTIDQQKQTAGFPDVYMACDRYYLDNVQQWFQEDVNVSQTEIVLVVPKGSDQVKSIEDIVKPGVRVSVGEPDQCTIGALTRRLLQQSDLYDRLKEKQSQPGEVVVEKSSSALIVPDVITGHVDVAIAYRNDVQDHGDKVNVIKIDSPLTRAIQPLSIAKNSQHKNLLRRLYRQVEKAEKNFESVGFDFLLAAPQSPL